MAKAAAQLTARVISPPAPLALGEPPRVLRTIQALWRGVGANPSAALPQVENMPIDEKEVALFATNAREMLARPASTREIKAAVTILQGAVKWPGGEVIHNKRAFLDLMCETLRDERLSAPIIELGVRAAIKTYRWMPTPAELLHECRTIQREIEAGLLYIEAPPEQRYPVAYGLAFLGDSREQAAASLRRRARRAQQLVKNPVKLSAKPGEIDDRNPVKLSAKPGEGPCI